jgi:hypothetical protein
MTSVYLISDPKRRYFKIGVADNVLRQIKRLSLPFVPELLASVRVSDRDVAFNIESLLHQEFSANHLNREWFRDIPVRDFATAAQRIIEDMGLDKFDCKILILKEKVSDTVMLKTLRNGGLEGWRKRGC